MAAYLNFWDLSREEQKNVLRRISSPEHYLADFAERNIHERYRFCSSDELAYRLDRHLTFGCCFKHGPIPFKLPLVAIGKKSYFALCYPPEHIIDA
ncbi:uncharacterized protein ARMOST_11964 [Armillaria ostoyae]|uniref:Uncharacterized protein n=1 Tax=Armillaria ostoyae TaxID=47428 RepID=A0A284RIK6_ARMOS|nr:uncharacterized protein ARMOST_11964 [Armillaria ostoyae]